MCVTSVISNVLTVLNSNNIKESIVRSPMLVINVNLKALPYLNYEVISESILVRSPFLVISVNSRQIAPAFCSDIIEFTVGKSPFLVISVNTKNKVKNRSELINHKKMHIMHISECLLKDSVNTRH